jgi:hypothetical protein
MFRAPKDIYGPNLLDAFVQELGGHKNVAKFLHVTERTVSRWLETGKVPRAAVLALYWESQYGRSQIFTDQVNEIRLLYRRVCLLQDQYNRAKDIVTGLRKLHMGTANEAIFDDMATITDLPPDTYGDPAPSTLAIRALHAAEQEQAKPIEPSKPISQGARAAMAAFEQERRVRAG